MTQEKIKEITYSSEFVNELERKIEYLKEENAELKHKYFISECEIHHLEMYKEALKMAITNALIIGGYDFWEKVAEAYDRRKPYDEFAKRNMEDPDGGVIEYYLFLVARKQSKKEWSEENAKCRKI